MQQIALDQVASVLARHTDHYRNRPPIYQHVMLNDLARIWQGRASRLLDIGGGTGVIAEAMQRLLPVDRVETVDVVDRFFPDLSVTTHVYDGERLPFANASFDAATINNVMHHIPVEVRGAVMAEIRRVVAGPVYIKDHVARSALDHVKLTLLDAIGNIPFGGQIKARYLTMPEWTKLANDSGYRIAEQHYGTYRMGAMAALFPNRLEAVFRLEPA
jgi:SAM-dependent methyltransferase